MSLGALVSLSHPLAPGGGGCPLFTCGPWGCPRDHHRSGSTAYQSGNAVAMDHDNIWLSHACAGQFPELRGHRGAWTRRGLATQPCSSIPPTCCRCILSAQSPDLPCAHSSRAGGCAAPRCAPRVLSSAFGYDPRRISEQICANSFIVRDGLSMGGGFDFYFHTFVFLSVVSIKDEC